MNEKLKYWLIGIGTLAALLLIGWLLWTLGERRGRAKQLEEDTVMFKPDTTYIHDTTTILLPAPSETRCRDTVYISVPSSSDDSTTVAIPIQQQVFTDDSNFRAVVSGYQAKIDSLQLYQTTKYITVPVVEKVPTKHNVLDISLGAEYYNAFQLPITVGYKYRWGSGIFLGGGVGYEPFQKKPIAQIKFGFEFGW